MARSRPPKHTPFSTVQGRPVQARPVQAYVFALTTGHTIQQAEQAAVTAGGTVNDMPSIAAAARAAMRAAGGIGYQQPSGPVWAPAPLIQQFESGLGGATLPGAGVYTATVSYEFIPGGVQGGQPGAESVWKAVQVDLPLGVGYHEAVELMRAAVREDVEGPEASYPGEALGFTVRSIIGH